MSKSQSRNPNWIDKFESESAHIDKLVADGNIAEAIKFIYEETFSLGLMFSGHIAKCHLNKKSEDVNVTVHR